MPPMLAADAFVRVGPVAHRGLDLAPTELQAGRTRHPFGVGPFVRLVMPPLPDDTGVYLWQEGHRIVYVGILDAHPNFAAAVAQMYCPVHW
ncbi:MAG TPA: hypothetical protein VND96_17735 [Candidatus Micrarchaeaceae archaeon]|nr:hypothetical protein [Candidatus Micrarchaeaceae archaeon]